MKNKQAALVAGGAGFIGSHLCEYLLNRGRRVICLDNFYTGTKNNVRHLLNDENFQMIRHDVIRPFNRRQLSQLGKIDEVYNLACPASPVWYQKDPIFSFKTSVWGAYNILELSQKNGAKFLQASTSEVYGDPLKHPQKESHWGNVNPIGIRSCYDEGKRGAETLIFDFKRKNPKLNIKVVRIFNTYGPRMAENDGRVVSNFIVQALTGKDITVYGRGDQTRSFCYVDDLVKGLYLMMRTPLDFIGPVNLGNPGEFTILELAEKVIKMTDSKSKIIRRPLPSDDPTKRKPDISLAKKMLGWEPRVKLEEGLKKTIEYFRGQK